MNTLAALALLVSLDAGSIPDTNSDIEQSEPCGYAPGTLGALCDSSAQCDSTICGDGAGEQRCTSICFGGCPPGFDCVPAGESAPAGLCYPDAEAELCDDVVVNVAEPNPPVRGGAETVGAAEWSPDAGWFQPFLPPSPGGTPASDPWDPNGPKSGPYVAAEPPAGGCAVGPTPSAPYGLAALLLIMAGLSRRLSLRPADHPTER